MKPAALTLAALAILALVWWTRIRTCAAIADDYGAWRDCRTDRLEWECRAMSRGRA